MKLREKTPHELHREGIAALTRSLGPVGTLRFLHQYDLGSGDYTAERADRLGNPTVDDLLQQLKSRRGQAKAHRGKA